MRLLRCDSPAQPTAFRKSASVGTRDGSIIAVIITIHMARNDAVASIHVCPGIRIYVIDIAQPPGIGIFAFDDIDPHQVMVNAALAAKSSADVPKNACCEVHPETVACDPLSAVILRKYMLSLNVGRICRGGATRGSSFRCAIEPLVHAP